MLAPHMLVDMEIPNAEWLIPWPNNLDLFDAAILIAYDIIVVIFITLP